MEKIVSKFDEKNYKINQKNYEIRIFIIGDRKIGKRSIFNRFSKLNTSKTIINEDSSIIKLIILPELTLGLRFFLINTPENIKFNDEIDENNKDENANKMKFNYSEFFEKLSDYHGLEDHSFFKGKPVEIKFCYLLCYDLSQISTLFALQQFKNEIKKRNKDFDEEKQMLVGNKLDKKTMLKGEELIVIKDFLGNPKLRENPYTMKKSFSALNLNSSEVLLKREDKTSSILEENIYKMPYYEISTKNFFNFEKFTNRFFFDLFEDIDPFFSSIYFKKHFEDVLNLKSNFSKSFKENFKTNNYPGPQAYDVADVLSIPSNKKIYTGGEKFNKKIFLNKIGPMFNHKPMEEYVSDRIKKIKNKEENNKPIEPFNPNPFNLPRDHYEKLYNNNIGPSFGVKTSSLKLKEERRKLFKDAEEDMKEIFKNCDNILQEKKALPKIEKITKKVESNRVKMLRRNSARIERFSILRNSLSQENHKKLIKSLSFESFEMTPSIVKKYEKKRIKSTKRRIPKDVIEPGPGQYEIRGKFNVEKGFTLGRRLPEIKKPSDNNASLLKLPSDFDIMNVRRSFSKSERFADKNRNNEDIKEASEKIAKIQNKLNAQSVKAEMIIRSRVDVVKDKERTLERKEILPTPGPGEYSINLNYLYNNSPAVNV